MFSNDVLAMSKFILKFNTAVLSKIVNYRYMNKPWALALGLFIVVRLLGGVINGGALYIRGIKIRLEFTTFN